MENTEQIDKKIKKIRKKIISKKMKYDFIYPTAMNGLSIREHCLRQLKKDYKKVLDCRERDIFTDKVLKNLGFKRVETKNEIYGEAHSKNGKIILNWCLNGPKFDYYKNPIKKSISFSVKEDGGTRTVFNGHIWTVNDLKYVLTIVD